MVRRLFMPERVTDFEQPAENRLAGSERLLLAGAGGLVLALLVLAACLRPSPNGCGTHQQLGLPPCTFQILFQVSCPTCGMTTAWAHVVRGEWLGAARANLGGALLAIAAVVAGPWLLASAARGRWCGARPNSAALACGALGWTLIVLVDWAVRLWAG